MNFKFRRIAAALAASLILLTGCSNTDSQSTSNTSTTVTDGSTLTVTYIDVGQGDSALLECDGHYMLIDGGETTASSVEYTVLKNKGIDTLDYMVMSHAHSDHIGGLPGALNYAKAEVALCPVTSYDSKAFENVVKYFG